MQALAGVLDVEVPLMRGELVLLYMKHFILYR
jgi:hypothetical protein